MKIFHRVFRAVSSAFLLCIFLLGCATNDLILSQENIDKANNACTQQVNLDVTLKVANWFFKWVECKKAKTMPFDLLIYPNKEKEIRSMYEQLILLSYRVDKGLMLVQEVYKEWDTMQKAIYMKQCLIRSSNADGSSECVKR